MTAAGDLLEAAQRFQMLVGEAETGATRLGDEGGRAERSPRIDLLGPRTWVLAGEADAALQRERARIAAGVLGVLTDALDKRLTLGVGREVRAPAVGEPSDPA